MNNANVFLQEAYAINDPLIAWRRALHQIPEIGTDLPQTMQYIRQQLEEMGIDCTL